jgi:hypothetical protein
MGIEILLLWLWLEAVTATGEDDGEEKEGG